MFAFAFTTGMLLLAIVSGL